MQKNYLLKSVKIGLLFVNNFCNFVTVLHHQFSLIKMKSYHRQFKTLDTLDLTFKIGILSPAFSYGHFNHDRRSKGHASLSQ